MGVLALWRELFRIDRSVLLQTDRDRQTLRTAAVAARVRVGVADILLGGAFSKSFIRSAWCD